jgi:hypothetical protein
MIRRYLPQLYAQITQKNEFWRRPAGRILKKTKSYAIYVNHRSSQAVGIYAEVMRCLKTKLPSAPSETRSRANRRARKPANSSAKKCIISGKESTARAPRSRPLPLDCPRPVALVSDCHHPKRAAPLRKRARKHSGIRAKAGALPSENRPANDRKGFLGRSDAKAILRPRTPACGGRHVELPVCAAVARGTKPPGRPFIPKAKQVCAARRGRLPTRAVRHERTLRMCRIGV